jgi:hypothetical protein
MKSYDASRTSNSNFNFVFDSIARFSGRLDPEIGLLHGALAGVTAVLQRYLHRVALLL